jgi:type IV secretory pathway VirB4 component
VVNRASFFRKYDEAGALHEVVAPKCFIDDAVFATGSGAVGVVLSLRGVDFETRTEESLDRVCDRFQNALRSFGPSFRIYQYLIKREGRRLPETTLNGAGAQWNESPRQFLEGRGLYSIDLYMVVLYEASSGSKIVSFLKGLSVQKTFNALDRRVLDSIELLRHGVDSFKAQVADLLGVQLLEKEAAFRFFRELLNPDPVIAGAVDLKHVLHVDFYSADTRVDWDKGPYMKWGEYWLRAFVLKDPPTRTRPGDRNKLAYLLRGIQKDVSTNMIILCLEWKPQPISQTLNTAKMRRRIRFGQTGVSQKKSQANQQQLNDLAAEDDVAEIGEAQRELRRTRFGDLSLTVLLFDQRLMSSAVCFRNLLGNGLLFLGS